jgi:hypothetical protein
MMTQNLAVNSTLTKMSRENYLPLFDNLLTEKPSAFMAAIKKVKLTGDNITAGAPIGLNGGFGFGAEGLETPAAGGQLYEKFKAYAKDLYVNLQISVKSTRLATKAGFLVDALHQEITSAYAAEEWNIGRALLGNGTGVLTDFSALSSAGNKITVDNTQYLQEGLIIDLYATGASTPQANGKRRRITSIDRVNKTITLAGDPATFSAGFITVQGSYMKELTGLGAIFDDSVTTLYGVKKSDNPVILPTVVDAGGDVSDEFLTDALMTAEDYKNSKVDMLLCGREAYTRYAESLRENNIRVESRAAELKGGFSGIKFIVGNRVVNLVYDKFVPTKEMWGVETSKCEYHHAPWDFATLEGSGAFTLMENSSVYRALLASFAEFVCKNPGGCIQIKNCVA